MKLKPIVIMIGVTTLLAVTQTDASQLSQTKQLEVEVRLAIAQSFNKLCYENAPLEKFEELVLSIPMSDELQDVRKDISDYIQRETAREAALKKRASSSQTQPKTPSLSEHEEAFKRLQANKNAQSWEFDTLLDRVHQTIHDLKDSDEQASCKTLLREITKHYLSTAPHREHFKKAVTKTRYKSPKARKQQAQAHRNESSTDQAETAQSSSIQNGTATTRIQQVETLHGLHGTGLATYHTLPRNLQAGQPLAAKTLQKPFSILSLIQTGATPSPKAKTEASSSATSLSTSNASAALVSSYIPTKDRLVQLERLCVEDVQKGIFPNYERRLQEIATLKTAERNPGRKVRYELLEKNYQEAQKKVTATIKMLSNKHLQTLAIRTAKKASITFDPQKERPSLAANLSNNESETTVVHPPRPRVSASLFTAPQEQTAQSASSSSAASTATVATSIERKRV